MPALSVIKIVTKQLQILPFQIEHACPSKLAWEVSTEREAQSMAPRDSYSCKICAKGLARRPEAH